MINFKLLVIGGAALAAVTGTSVWLVQDWRYGKQIAEAKNEAWETYRDAMQDRIELEYLRGQREQTAAELAELRAQKQEVITRTVTNEVIKYVQDPTTGQCVFPDSGVRILNYAATGQRNVSGNADTASELNAGPDPATDTE